MCLSHTRGGPDALDSECCTDIWSCSLIPQASADFLRLRVQGVQVSGCHTLWRKTLTQSLRRWRHHWVAQKLITVGQGSSVHSGALKCTEAAAPVKIWVTLQALHRGNYSHEHRHT
uniref:Uncharacterized protein n=1 Tax=Knipowitschia caucasica TaxID=637954 RepID=A0AAV2J191_KNICA